jgi:glycine reductase
MAAKYRAIYCLNQFFGGLGGEEKASLPPGLVQGAKGPGMLLQKLFQDVQVTETLIFGDNYVAENTAVSVQEILALLEPCFSSTTERKPDLLLAGPAFNAGRYGLACGAICKAVQDHFGIPTVTAMYPENPAVNEYKKNLYIARAGKDVMALEEAVQRMGSLGLKLLHQQSLLPEKDEYIPQGCRKNYFDSRTGVSRAVNMLLKKLKGEPFETEYPMPTFDRVEPAPAIEDMSKARLALVTSGGIVPLGNPDKIAAASAQRFGSYSLEGLTALTSQTHQTAHGGYDPTYANANPNRVLPLDAVRELEAEGVIGTIHGYYYATVGNATSVDNAREFGKEIAQILLRDGVQAVILTST